MKNIKNKILQSSNPENLDSDNIPRLRFPEFTGAWEKKKLGEVAPLQRGFDLPVDKINEGEFPVVFSNGILKFHNEFKVKAPGVVTGRSGTIGKVTFVEKDFWPHNTALWVTDFKYNDPKYIFYFYSKYGLERFGTGSGVPTLNRNDVHIQKESFPSLPEQTKIANFLTAVDERLQALKKKKELLEQYKKGVMQGLFLSESGFTGLKDEQDEKHIQDEQENKVVKNVERNHNPKILKSGKSGFRQLRFTQPNGKPFPDWEVKKLGEVCDVIGGGTPETNIEEYWNGEINWFTPTEIKSNYVTKSLRTITKLGLQKSSAKLLPIGTILLTTRATIGEASIALEECTTNQGFQSLITKKGISNVFIFNWIKENKQVFTSKANGSTFPEISKTEIEKIEIPIPSLPEQTLIANFLSALDEKIQAVQQQIEKTERWKKGLLQEMFV